MQFLSMQIFFKRNFKGLLQDFYRMLELKKELIEEAAYKVTFFDESEIAFFTNKLPILTHSYCTPDEIKF